MSTPPVSTVYLDDIQLAGNERLSGAGRLLGLWELCSVFTQGSLPILGTLKPDTHGSRHTIHILPKTS